MSDALRSPRLDALLGRLKRGLVRGVMLHGVGTVAAAAAGWLLFAALADYFLHLPLAIRVLHGLVAIALPIYLVRRSLLTPLGRIPGREGLALLLERNQKDSEDLLVSAVELPPRFADTPARPLVERVVARAEERAANLDPRVALDPRGPRKRALAGTLLSVTLAGLAMAQPALAAIFLERLIGGSARWPQLTYLTLEVSAAGDGVQVEEQDDLLLVRAARGSDIPVLVRAEGKIPRRVTVHFADGPEVSIQGGGSSGLFRTLLRSVQEDTSFQITGGDDDRRLQTVQVIVLQPPDVGGVAWSVTPPTYSGLEPFVTHAPDVEVLQGSQVTVHLLPDPPEASGFAHLFPGDTRSELTPLDFPPTSPGGAARPGLGFELEAELSMRVSFELTDDTGLPNPDPGLFALTVVEDRRPEVLLLAPGRADLDVVLGGALPLRVRVEDDFGVACLAWDVRLVTSPDEAVSSGELDRQPITDTESAYSSARVQEMAVAMLEVDALGGGAPVTEGLQFYLQVLADDVREPAPNQTPSAPVRVRVVSGEEYLRNLQEQLARAGESARRVYELAQERETLHRDLLSAGAGEEPDEGYGDLSPMLHGLRRVQGDARALARDLAFLAEGMLYSRLDPRGAALLGFLDRELALENDRSFHAAPWIRLSGAHASGQLGQADLAGTLVEIVGLGLAVSETHLNDAADALTRAAEAQSPADARVELALAVAAQAQARITLDELRVKLGEWDNFQSVLTLTRDIIERQKLLIQRTKQIAEDGK